MARPSRFLILVLCLCAATSAVAQQRFLADGQSGYGAAVEAARSRRAWIVGGDLTFTWRSRLDVGVSMDRIDVFGSEPWGLDSENQTTPHVSVALVRPEQAAGLGLEAVYSRPTVVDGDDLDAWATVVGFSTYYRARGTHGVEVLPYLSLARVRAVAEVLLGGEEDEITAETTLTAIGVSVLAEGGMVVTPSITWQGDETVFALAVGLVKPLSRDRRRPD